MNSLTQFPPPAAPTYFFAGQKVRITSPRFNGLATVKKHLQKNVDIVMDDGTPVRCHPSFLSPVMTDEGKQAFAPLPVQAFTPPQVPGTIVKCSPRVTARNPRLAGLWVVIGDQGGKTRIVKIGGDAGRYWRIPNEDIIKVDVPNVVNGFTGH